MAQAKKYKYRVTSSFVVTKTRLSYCIGEILELTKAEAKAFGTLVEPYVEGE